MSIPDGDEAAEARAQRSQYLRRQIILWIAAGVLIASGLSMLFLGKSGAMVVGSVLSVAGGVCALQALFGARSTEGGIKTLEQNSGNLTWKLRDDGVGVFSGEVETMQLPWSEFRRAYISNVGILLYSRRELFHALLRRHFKNPVEFEAAVRLVIRRVSSVEDKRTDTPTTISRRTNGKG